MGRGRMLRVLRLLPVVGVVRVVLAAALSAVAVVTATPTPALAAPASTLPRAATATAVVSGRVVDQAGHPVAGARVVFADDVNAFVAVATGLGCTLSVVASLGLFFFIQPSFDKVCGPDAVAATTGRDGRFRMTLPAGAPVTQRGPHHVSVTGRAPARRFAAARTFRDVFYRGGRLDLGSTMLWQPRAVVRRSGDDATITIAPPRGARVAGAGPLRGTDGGIAWTVALDSSGSGTVDARVLETGTRSIESTASAGHIRYSSWQAAVPTYGAPTSRGVGCATYTVNSTLASFARCPFTDGRLGTALGLRGAMTATPSGACQYSSDCASPNTVVLDLHDVRLLRAVVWRGCSFCATPQISVDGQTWLDWPNATKHGFSDAVITGQTVPVRYVRVQGDVFIFWELRELSVWTDPVLPQLTPGASLRLPVAPTALPTALAPLTDVRPLGTERGVLTVPRIDPRLVR